MKKNKNRPERVILVVLVAFSAIAVAVFAYSVSEDKASAFWQSFFLSILSSLIASGVFYIMQSAFDGDIKMTIESKVDEIEGKIRRIDKVYDSGVLSIRSKGYYDKNGEFWKHMIKITSDKLDLVGREISPWFSSEYRTEFINKVMDMVKNGKRVRIILSGDAPNMEKIYEVEKGKKEERELNKIESTCYELRKIIQKIKENQKNQKKPKKITDGGLDVYIAELKRVSYMYIRTDDRCYMSPYVFAGDSFLLEMEVGVEYSRWLDMDFENMLKVAKKINLEMNHDRETKVTGRKFLRRK